MSARPLLVVKFGGTSLEPAERAETAARTVADLARETAVVVVVSAPGRAGSPYATDTLLGLTHQEGMGEDPAEVDALIACGEVVSAALFALRLRGLGLDARSLTGAQAGIVTDGVWGQARLTGVDSAPLRELAAAGTIPVVAGFQGDHQGRTTTLGRGGSDLSAVALGAALEAPVVIFTDVDGVYTADPRLVADARRLPALSYEDAALLSYRGAKVLHPRAAEMALGYRVEVTVARPPEATAGTLITDAGRAAQRTREVAEPLVVGGVTAQSDRVQLTLEVGDPGAPAGGDLTSLFDGLAGAGISLDLIDVGGDHVRFTVDAADRAAARKVLTALGIGFREREGCAKVSVVGGGMHGRPGVMARVVRALQSAGVPILQSADAHNVISCLVPGEQEHEAVRSLHREFFGIG
jgi:aspartate kinase